MKFVNVAVTCCTVLFQVREIVSDFPQNPCPDVQLLNGRVKFRSKGRVAKFKCDPTYQLLGNRSAVCIRGTWDTDVPLCIKNDCPQISKNPRNGYWIENYRGASYTLLCNAGFHVQGVRVIYCHNKRWSDEIPFCDEIHTTCDFEKDLCGWTQNLNNSFKWNRHNFATPSSQIGTGPSFDHTLGESQNGHYLYIESSSPHSENDTARLFSPAYESHLSEQACFIFWYHMYGATIGALNVYQKLQSSTADNMTRIFHKAGEQRNKWLMGFANLTIVNQQFEIVIEALRGRSYLGDIAIDDVKLLKGEECINVTAQPASKPTTQISMPSPSMTTEPAILISRTARVYPTFLPPPPPPIFLPIPPLFHVFPIPTSAQPNTESNLSTTSQKFTMQKTNYFNQYNVTLPSSSSTHYTRVTHFFNVSLNRSSTMHLETTPSVSYDHYTYTKNISHSTTSFTKPVLNSNTYISQLSTKNMVDMRGNPTAHTHFPTQSSILHKYITTTHSPQVPKKIPSFSQYSPTVTTLSQKINQVQTSPSLKYDDRRNNTLLHTTSAIPHTKYNERLSTVTQTDFPIQRSTTLKTGIISPFKQEYRTTLEPSTVLEESKAEPNVSYLPSIAGATGGIAGVAIIAALLVFILSRRITRFKKQKDMSEDSDVRFLTSDEVLDFTLARPSDDDDL